jgi:hypothetical protein
MLQGEVKIKLSHDEENQAKSGFRYDEHGVPIFDRRLNEIESEQAKARERDEKYKDQQVVLNQRMARFTLALVLVSASTGGISIWQATIARRSANAAKRAADTSSKQEIAWEVSQRPWIEVANQPRFAEANRSPYCSIFPSPTTSSG